MTNLSITTPVAVATLLAALVAPPTYAAGKFGMAAPKVHQSTQIMARDIQVASTSGNPSDEARCKRYEAGINSWADANVDAVQALDEKGARTAERNTQGLIDEATDNGCFVIY